jgi:hypothetical protein
MAGQRVARSAASKADSLVVWMVTRRAGKKADE